MKLFQTIVPDCPWSAHIARDEEEIVIYFTEETRDGCLRLNPEKLLEQFPVGERERADCVNFYITGKDKNLYLINKYADTYYTKADGHVFGEQLNQPIYGQVYIPFADSPLDEWAVRLNSNTDITFDRSLAVSVPTIPKTTEGFTSVVNEVLPALRVTRQSQPDENGKYQITVQVTLDGADMMRSGVRIFAKSASGYIPVREKHTNIQGQAVFDAYRLGLAADEPMLTEFGFKFRTNLATAELRGVQ